MYEQLWPSALNVSANTSSEKSYALSVRMSRKKSILLAMPSSRAGPGSTCRCGVGNVGLKQECVEIRG